jgi:hypothetical protein
VQRGGRDRIGAGQRPQSPALDIGQEGGRGVHRIRLPGGSCARSSDFRAPWCIKSQDSVLRLEKGDWHL